jgi:diguanylate cyclase (GGDEF)-like protein/PAS domain S-box-containing protein
MTLHPARSALQAKALLSAALLPRWAWWVLAGVLAAGNALSLAAWRSSLAAEDEAARLHFERRADDAAHDLRQRLDAAARLLRSASALFAASNELQREEWKAFTDQQQLADNYPGVMGLGYAQLLQRQPDAAPVAPVLWREPADPIATRVIGRDLLADPVRRDAMARARDSGRPALSAATGPLVRRPSLSGAPHEVALMFYPVYRPGLPLHDEAQRHRALLGWVYAPLNIRSMMRQLASQRGAGMHLVLHDGPAGQAGDHIVEANAAERVAAGPGWQPRLLVERRLEVNGRQWTLRMAGLPGADAARHGRHASLVLASGLVMTLLATLLVGTLLALRGRALESARSAAQEAGAFNETILANAPFCVIVTDEQGRLRSINPAGERMLGYGPGELIGCDSVPQLHLDHELRPLAARLSREKGRELSVTQALGVLARRGECSALECSYVRKDGTPVPVVLALAPLARPGGHVAGYVGIAYDITERKRNESYIRHMAHHDELTGLPNRSLLHERAAVAIEAAHQRHGRVAVMLIDLDRFKQINDSLGHHAGDVVLCAVAARLKHCLRSGDTVARMGGDEFVILLPDVNGTRQAERVADKLLRAMVEPVQAGPHRLAVTPSIGIACWPDDGEDLSTLLRNADTAMYACKNNGRNHYTLYTPQMHSASALRLALEGDLRQALERSELQLHYQPLVSLADGEVVGVEALLRWNHPVRGAVSPVDFIPIAEDTGLIVPIGEWVLRTACADMQRLQRETGRRLTVAVNLSPRQLRTPKLTETIADALASAGWPAELLKLEITESMVIENPDASVAAMQRLCAMGVGLAIDDFGTGHSSLSYLSRFPVAQLKIDRSFVRGLPGNEREAAIATAIVAMGHGLKLQVLAEGIETEAQRRFLHGLGCDLGQGWLFARPMPMDALTRHLRQLQRMPSQAEAEPA